MLYQLPSGRTIEISLEQYLEMTPEELNELDCLSNSYTMEINNPFYGSYSKGRVKKEPEYTDEQSLTDIPDEIKREDSYLHNKDDE